MLLFLFLFYLQVEPVFLPACLNKAIQITSVSSISATNIDCQCLFEECDYISSSDSIFRYNFVSSAKRIMSLSTTSVMSATNTRNKIGPRTDPCGTTHNSLTSVGEKSFNSAYHITAQSERF